MLLQRRVRKRRLLTSIFTTALRWLKRADIDLFRILDSVFVVFETTSARLPWRTKHLSNGSSASKQRMAKRLMAICLRMSPQTPSPELRSMCYPAVSNLDSPSPVPRPQSTRQAATPPLLSLCLTDGVFEQLLCPVPDANLVPCIGLNYRQHATEANVRTNSRTPNRKETIH